MSSARYYKKQRKIAKRKAREKYQNLPEEKKVKKANNIDWHERYKNLPEGEKLVHCKENYFKKWEIVLR